MDSIVYVGMDVHKESYTVCCYTYAADRVQYQQKIAPDYKLVLKYLEQVRKRNPEATEYVCGYEAGCLGYTLYHQLTEHGVKCVILAPTTMEIRNTNRMKTDKKDAANIARCLAFHTYSAVHIPTEEDNAIKEYIRMRDDQKKALKIIKQQILALVLRHGYRFEGGKSYWTIAHVKWLKSLNLGSVLQESLTEYLVTYEYLVDKIERFDRRIEELASADQYQEKVKKLSCLIGVKTHTALSAVVEVGDFERFAKADRFAAYLGLVPSEESSGESQKRAGITKAGNSHLRRLLVEAAQGYTRGTIGHKSVALKKRQSGNAPEVIAYADKANERLRRKFYRLTLTNKVNRKRVVTVTEIEERYAAMFESDTGNIAKPVRMAVGALVIKQETGLSDDSVVQAVLGNPYMQFFIGLHEFTLEAPFSSTSMVYFRKRLGGEVMKEINEMCFAPPQEEDHDDDSGDDSGDGSDAAHDEKENRESQGFLLLDATCAPADITYPTDVGLLNEAREKLEGIIDVLYPHTGISRKPRIYRHCARRDCIWFVKKRRKGKKEIQKAIRKQLGYVRRNPL